MLRVCLLYLLAPLPLASLAGECQEGGLDLCSYPSHEAMLDQLYQLERQYPRLARVASLGESWEGRQLASLVVGRGVDRPRHLLKPMVQLVGNMHGDETVGRQLVLYLAHYLLTHQNQREVSFLLDTTELHLVPTINPDGFVRSRYNPVNASSCVHRSEGRRNARTVDLNRSFPDIWHHGKDSAREALLAGKEPEVAAIMSWVLDSPFVLSANFHGGALVASYPWDSIKPSREVYTAGRQVESLTPDNAMYRLLASTYARHNPPMFHQDQLDRCIAGSGGPFPEGVTNGAFWYNVRGSMQDFIYHFTDCMAITLEVSCCKHPHPQELAGFWEENRESMVAFSQLVHSGVKGQVVDELGRPVEGATVTVEGNARAVTTSDRGEFWKLLTPGNYTVSAGLNPCTSPSSSSLCLPSFLASDPVNVTVTASNLTQATLVNFTLKFTQWEQSGLMGEDTLGAGGAGSRGSDNNVGAGEAGTNSIAEGEDALGSGRVRNQGGIGWGRVAPGLPVSEGEASGGSRRWRADTTAAEKEALEAGGSRSSGPEVTVSGETSLGAAAGRDAAAAGGSGSTSPGGEVLGAGSGSTTQDFLVSGLAGLGGGVAGPRPRRQCSCRGRSCVLGRTCPCTRPTCRYLPATTLPGRQSSQQPTLPAPALRTDESTTIPAPALRRAQFTTLPAPALQTDESTTLPAPALRRNESTLVLTEDSLAAVVQLN